MKLSKRQKLFLTCFLGAMAALAPLSTDMYLPALPTVQYDLGITTSLAQMTLTMTMVGMALGQIFAGPLSDMRGRKVPLLIGMIVFTGAVAGCVFSRSIFRFLVFRFITGFAGSCGIVISRAIARDIYEGAELTRFFAILMMINGLAPILAPILGGQILLFTSWRGIFVVLTGIAVMLTTATLIYRETLPKEQRLKNLGATFAKYPQLLKDRYFRGHCLLQCFIFGAFFTYLAGSSFVFQNIYDVSPQGFSLIFGGIGVGLLLMGSLPARFAGRIPDVVMLKNSVLVSVIGSAVLLVCFFLAMPLFVIVPVLFVTIVPLSVIGAASFSLALSRQGKNAGSASALIGFFSMILGGLMMPVVGIAGDHNALPMSFIMFLGYGLGYLCFLRMIAPEHKAELHR